MARRRQEKGGEMKRFLQSAVLLLLYLPALAQSTNQDMGMATLTLLSPFTIDGAGPGTMPLNFGTIIPSRTNTGALTISADGEVQTPTGGIVYSGGANAGRLIVSSSDPLIILSVQSAQGEYQLIHQSNPAAPPLRLYNITSTCDNGGAGGQVQCYIPAGQESLNIGFGGTLEVAPSQPAGHYTGEITFRVTY